MMNDNLDVHLRCYVAYMLEKIETYFRRMCGLCGCMEPLPVVARPSALVMGCWLVDI